MSSESVSLNPSEFAEDGGLLDLSLEDVVSLFLDREKQRHKLAKDDENQQEVLVGYRCVPMGLVMSLDGNARRLGVTRGLLTRCMSHQIATWIDSLDRVKAIIGLFNSAHDAAEEFGYPDLYDDMAPKYLFANTAPRAMSFRTISWVKNKLVALSLPLGIPAGALFIIGLCSSLMRAGVVSKGNIDKYLAVEVTHFSKCLGERSVTICAFNDKVRRRAAEDGLDNMITG